MFTNTTFSKGLKNGLLGILAAAVLTACAAAPAAQPASAAAGSKAPAPASAPASISQSTAPSSQPAQTTTPTAAYGAKGALADNSLTLDEMMHYAIQDEWIARGEYVAIMEKFAVQNPYANIKRSEETHIGYMENLFKAKGMTVPANNSQPYIHLPANLLEAAKAGVAAEVDNIAMYEKFLAQPDLPADVKDVFQMLKNGSVNHLAAFQRQVDRLS